MKNFFSQKCRKPNGTTQLSFQPQQPSLQPQQPSLQPQQPTLQPQVVDFKKMPAIISAGAVKKIDMFPNGTGGLGDVWTCSWREESCMCKVAVKSVRIPHTNDEKLVEKIGKRIRRETHVWIDLDHDNILKFLGIVEGFGPLPALVAPWMENGSLDRYLKPHIDQVEALRMLKQIAAGLKYRMNNYSTSGSNHSFLLSY
ncbi:hypothetical protein AZE42_12457 [Rhizopogon vesiculosus]|uniref:Protein kinase domain-containing protein n=1 Tax=Rhizopogon vesiculosus TaxID=180088 RepID=A0A1J8QIZ5_9AGAM|nr:hypothetical protein AZE42_12457 [Rhizopogon vesiculosus]